MPASVISRKSPSYADTVYHGTRLAEACGIIVNTAAELEPAVLAAINDGRCTGGRPAPPVYPIGPVIPLSDATNSDHECLRWLDVQPRASVVFLCFGSLGFLNAEQVREAAAGLERSAQRFLWVLRSSPRLSTRWPSFSHQGSWTGQRTGGSSGRRGRRRGRSLPTTPWPAS